MRFYAHPWLVVAVVVTFLQSGLLTPRRSFGLSTGLRFIGLGMALVTAVVLPLELLAERISGCYTQIAADACKQLGVFPDPVFDEGVRLAVLVAAVLLVRRYRAARLSDLVFWALCLGIGGTLVEESLRYAGLVSGLVDQRYLMSGPSFAERSDAWRFLFDFPPEFRTTSGRFGTSGAVGPVLGPPIVVEMIGVWVLLQRLRWRWPVGLVTIALGFTWLTFDHAMINDYLNKATFFGVVVDSLAGNSGPLGVWLHYLGHGHPWRYAVYGTLVLAFVVDEIAYCRVHGQRFGARFLAELQQLWRSLWARQPLTGLRLNQLCRRADAAVVAPLATVDDAGEAMRDRLRYEWSTVDPHRPPLWRRVLGVVRGVRIPPGTWLLWCLRLFPVAFALVLLVMLGTGRLAAAGAAAKPALFWLTLAVLATGILIAVVDGVRGSRHGDRLWLLLVAFGVLTVGMFQVLPTIARSMWHLPLPAHFIAVLHDFLTTLLSALGPDPFGHVLTTLGFALAAAALAIGAGARWWQDSDARPWIIGTLIVLAILASLLLPFLLPAELAWLLPLVIWAGRAINVALTLDRLSPAIEQEATATGYDLQARSYAAIGNVQRAADARAKADAANAQLAALQARNTADVTQDPVLAGLVPGDETGITKEGLSAMEKVRNIIRDPVGDINSVQSHNHYAGARQEAAQGIPISWKDGKPQSHIGDLQQARNGLKNAAKILRNELNNSNLTQRGQEAVRAYYTQARDRYVRLQQFLTSIGHGEENAPTHKF